MLNLSFPELMFELKFAGTSSPALTVPSVRNSPSPLASTRATPAARPLSVILYSSSPISAASCALPIGMRAKEIA
jgi:hypothetical protein